MRPVFCTLFLGAAAALSCSSLDEPPYQPCTPGQSAACTCSDGRSGRQLCDASGDKYAVCQCEEGSGGAGASSSSTGGASTSSSSSSSSSSASSGTGGETSTTTATGGGGGSSSSTATGGGGASSSSTTASGGGATTTTATGAGGGTVAGAWAHAYGSSTASVTSLATDSSGAVVAVGNFTGSLSIGASQYACGSSSTCTFVVKVTSAGGLVWSEAFTSTSSNVRGPRVAVGTSDEVVIAGTFDGDADFDSLPETVQAPSMYVIALDAQGNRRWFQSYSQPNAMFGEPNVGGVGVDSLGRVDVGATAAGLDFGSGTVAGAFVVQLDAAGNVRWWAPEDQIPGPVSFALTGTGDVVSVVDTELNGASGNIPCGATLASDSNTYVAAFEADTGACKFVESVGHTAGTAVAVDPTSGAIFVTGTLSAPFTSGVGTITPSHGGYVLSFDSAGHLAWGRAFGGTGTSNPIAVAVDATTHAVAITGATSGTVDLGGGPASGSGQVFLVTLAADGTAESATQYGDAQPASGNAVGVSSDGQWVVLGGSFDGALSFGPGLLLQVAGTQSAFVAQLPMP